jgi:pyruvate, orthophosphate dikinase
MSGSYSQPLVYFFGQGRADGTAAMKDVLGGKGAGLAEMTTIGIPVPPGFTIASNLCLHYLESRQFTKRVRAQVEDALQRLESASGKYLGDGDNPLLVSVRSGAAVSMPGMMETILNLGLNDVTVEGLTRLSGNARFAWDSYRRFVQMYGSVVFDLSKKPFEQILEEHKHRCRIERDIDLPVEEMQAIVRRFKEHVRKDS